MPMYFPSWSPQQSPINLPSRVPETPPPDPSGGVLVLGVPFRSGTMRTKEKAPPRTGPSASLQLKFWSAEGAAFLPSGKTISGRGETFPPSRNKLRRASLKGQVFCRVRFGHGGIYMVEPESQLAGCWEKTEWANTEIAKLESDIREFSAANPYEIRSEADVERGQEVWRFKLSRKPRKR